MRSVLGELLAGWGVCPEADQAVKALHDHGDDAVVSQCVANFPGCGTALSHGPGEEPAELGGQVGLKVTPAARSERAVCRPCAIVHADKSGNGQEGLTGNPDTKLVRGYRPGVQLVPP
jgi:hypothetical protein